MRIAFFEDREVDGLQPLSSTRPVFELVCGQFSLRERLIRRFDVSAWGGFLRAPLAEMYVETFPDAAVNRTDWLAEGPTLLVNGRWLPSLEALAEIRDDEAGVLNEQVMYLTLHPEEASLLSEGPVDETIERLARTRRLVATAGRLISFPWDLIEANGPQLYADFRWKQHALAALELGEHVHILGDRKEALIDRTAYLDPFIVIDTRRGPVTIDAGAVIQSFTRIEGPCHIGMGTQLFRAHIREATTLGPVCRVGGEVEASILHSHVNKYHEGFLGHSYICPWVNLGAMAAVSDLKADYSPIGVPFSGGMLDSGLMKVGCYAGDHAKVGLGCLLNCGTSIGAMSIALPVGELLPKYLPPFSRFLRGFLEPAASIEDLLEIATTAMERRGVILTESTAAFYRRLFDQTADERHQAIERFREKTIRQVAKN